MSETVESHRRAGAGEAPAVTGVLTISDTRDRAGDGSGDAIEALLREHGLASVERDLVRDDAPAIAARLEAWLADPRVGLVLTTGGTGIGRRDTTVEVVRRVLTAELEGFGELFRAISYAEIGASAMLSRAVGGLVARDSDAGGDTFVFAMPGSPNAVRTAMTRLVLPEIGHLLAQRRV